MDRVRYLQIIALLFGFTRQINFPRLVPASHLCYNIAVSVDRHTIEKASAGESMLCVRIIRCAFNFFILHAP